MSEFLSKRLRSKRYKERHKALFSLIVVVAVGVAPCCMFEHPQGATGLPDSSEVHSKSLGKTASTPHISQKSSATQGKDILTDLDARASAIARIDELLGSSGEIDWEVIAAEVRRVQNGGNEKALVDVAAKILAAQRPSVLTDGHIKALRSALYILGVSEAPESLDMLLKYCESEAWGSSFEHRWFRSPEETRHYLTGAAIEQIGRKPPDIAMPILREFEARFPKPAPEEWDNYNGLAVQWALEKVTRRLNGLPYDDASMRDCRSNAVPES